MITKINKIFTATWGLINNTKLSCKINALFVKIRSVKLEYKYYQTMLVILPMLVYFYHIYFKSKRNKNDLL